MKKISIYCDGGLGNRLSTIIGGIHLAKKINYDYEILWPQARWCNCNFDDLYDKKNNYVNLSINPNDYIIHNNINLIISHVNIGYPKNIKTIPQSNNISNINFSNYSNIFYYNNSIPIYISSEDSSKYLSKIKISEYILGEVKKFINEFNISNQTLGLHIRRTDGPMIISNDEYFNFINRLYPKQVFVCSDEEDIEKKLQNHFKNVISRNKLQYVEKFIDAPWITDKLPEIYNIVRDRQSVIDAFIDMLILSRTNILNFRNIGTFYQLSKLYKKIEL
jgi:hypothetical protein